ncbi:MAG: TetR family transcriptional regulator [Lachnospiraceae bacterium]|nr:TetR family transcriptional regulator [Lachnospiraceae bacterium]
MRKTKEDAAVTKKALLDSAYELFYDHGFENTTLAQIAEHAGLTRGAVYWHFKDKSEILNELIITFMDEQISYRYLQNPEAGESVYDCLLKFYRRPPEIRKKMFFINRIYALLGLYPEYEPLANKVKEHKRFLYNQIQELLQNAVENGHCELRGSSYTVATTIFMVLETIHLYDSYHISEKELTVDDLERILRLLIVEK